MCVCVSFSLSPIIISALYLQYLKALTRLLAFVISTANSKYFFYQIANEMQSREEKESTISEWGGQRFANERKTGDFSSPLDATRRPLPRGVLIRKEHLALDDKKRNKKQNLPASSAVQVCGHSVSGQGWRSSFLRANGVHGDNFF